MVKFEGKDIVKSMDVKMMGLVLIYLMVLGIQDLRSGTVPMKWLIAGALILPCIGVLQCMQGDMQWKDLLIGTIPGILMLAIAKLTQKAGYADGIVLLELGLCVGYRKSVALFCFSLLLLAVVSAVLLVLKKVHRNTKIPFLPFLFVIFCIQELAG